MFASGTQTLPTLLAKKTLAHPDKTVLVFENADGAVSTLSYASLSHAVNRLCNSLVASGLEPGQSVALMMGNCTEFLVSWLAINQAGAVMVPVNVFYAPDELSYLLNTADCVAFISEPRFLPVYAEVSTKCPTVRIHICGRTDDATPGFQLLSDILRSGDATQKLLPMLPEEPSQIVFTSGTTSRPKGAIISHLATMLQGIAVAQVLGMTPDDRSCVVLPLFHVNAQFMSVVPTLTVGGTIIMIETYSATRFWAQVRKHDCTLMSIVPMQLRTMLAQTPHSDDAVHRVRLSFYALLTTDEEWTRFEERFGVRLVEGYGLSETLGICTCNPAVFGQIKRHCIGLPVPGREIRVMNEEGVNQPYGKPGRIMVRGQPMFSGYFKNPEASKACMVEDWFDTGDNGFFDEDGYLHFFDRSKDVIKRAGENVAASEVERVLNEHPKIAESAVISVPDPLRDEAVKAFVVIRQGEVLSIEEMKDWCLKHLAKFKVPSFYEYIDVLPKTSIGKIMKYQLKQRDSDGVHQKTDL
jgi:crotonobetaine/carnitine-CoA ligase